MEPQNGGTRWGTTRWEHKDNLINGFRIRSRGKNGGGTMKFGPANRGGNPTKTRPGTTGERIQSD